jgi:hypothetical protein
MRPRRPSQSDELPIRHGYNSGFAADYAIAHNGPSLLIQSNDDRLGVGGIQMSSCILV